MTTAKLLVPLRATFTSTQRCRTTSSAYTRLAHPARAAAPPNERVSVRGRYLKGTCTYRRTRGRAPAWARLMQSTRDALRSMGLPAGDLGELPTSDKRFPDGAQYRVEIPSVEGPRCLEAAFEEADRLGVPVHRISQGSGVFLHTDEELDELARLAAAASVEVSLFTRPNAGWGTSAMARSPVG